MGSLPGWLPVLLEKLNWGCSTSPWFIDLADESRVLERGRRIIFDLWPYIRELPLNIATVRSNLPERMMAAAQLLNKLGDDERHYQKLFLQQFDLAGVSKDELGAAKMNAATENFCLIMSTMCTKRSYAEGIHAIVAAELAATMYCRASLPSYENYFEKHSSEYEPGLIESGLEWIRLHAKTHTRHAILMKRMLNDLGDEPGQELPEAAEAILNGVLALWECPIQNQDLVSTSSQLTK